MVTWTTYGNWLQGDKRGYVKNGQILPGNKNLYLANQRQQKSPSVKLDSNQKRGVENAILKEAEKVGQNIFAIAVCANHVHLVVEVSTESIEKVVHRYKRSATFFFARWGWIAKYGQADSIKGFASQRKNLKTKSNMRKSIATLVSPANLLAGSLAEDFRNDDKQSYFEELAV